MILFLKSLDHLNEEKEKTQLPKKEKTKERKRKKETMRKKEALNLIKVV